MTLTRRIGDLDPISVGLREESGSAVNLSGSSVTARAVQVATGAVVIDDRACTVESAADGFVVLDLEEADTAAGREGLYDLTFRVTDSEERPRTFPIRGPLKLNVTPR